MKKVEIYQCDDWVRIYVDDIIVVDGHSLSIYDLHTRVLPELGVESTRQYFEEEDLGEFGDDFEGAVNKARKV